MCIRDSLVKYEYPGDEWMASTTMSDRALLCAVDFRVITEDPHVDRTMTLRASSAGTINGLRISSTSTLADGSTFGASSAYSYPIVMPVEDLVVEEGEELTVSVQYELCGGMRGFNYRVSRARP